MSKKRVFVLNHTGDRVVVGWSDPLQAESFQLLTTAKGEPSGFVVMKDGTLRIGQELYSADFPSIGKIYLNVYNLSDIPDNLQVIYAKSWREKIEILNPELFEDCEAFWVIGCPVSDTSTIIQYKMSFEAAGYTNVNVIPIDNCLKHSFRRCLDIIDDSSEALYIDLGVYHSKAIYISDGVLQSVNRCIGISQIEKMILFKNLTGNFNPPEVSQAIFQKCINNSNFANYLLLYVRKLLKNCSVEHEARKISIPNIGKALGAEDISFTLTIDAKMLRSVLDEDKVSFVLPTDSDFLSEDEKKYIGGKTWTDCLINFLEETAEEIPEFINANSKRKKKIIAAGDIFANSGIDIIEEIVLYRFPVNEEEYESRSIAPVANLTECLSQLGGNTLNEALFLEHLDFIFSHDANGNEVEREKSVLYEIARQTHYALVDNIISDVYEKISKIWQEQIFSWRDGNITAQNIIPSTKDIFYKWFELWRSTSIQNMYGKWFIEARARIVKKVNTLFEPLSKQLINSNTFLENEDIVKNNSYTHSFSEKWLVSNYTEGFESFFDNANKYYSKLANPGLIPFGTTGFVTLMVFKSLISQEIDFAKCDRKAYYTQIEEELQKHKQTCLDSGRKKMALYFKGDCYPDEQLIAKSFEDIKNAIFLKAKSLVNQSLRNNL